MIVVGFFFSCLLLSLLVEGKIEKGIALGLNIIRGRPTGNLFWGEDILY